MNKILKLLICLLILTSCAKKREGEQKTGLLSNFISISENEDKGIKEILSFYSGYCEYSVGISTSSKTGNKKYFELKMSKSDVIENQSNKIHLPSSNIAYLFFKNLKEEKKNYDEIHVVIILKDNSKQEFKFSISLLEKVQNRMTLANKTVNFLKEKKFDSIKSMLNNKLITFDKEEIIPRLKEIEPQLGEIKEFRFFGFKIIPYKGIEVLHLSGVLLRDKQNNEFSIDIDFNSKKNELYQFQYKL